MFGKDLKGWPADPQGYTLGGWGLNVTLREMNLFGLLYLNKGIWKGQEIIAEKWI